MRPVIGVTTNVIESESVWHIRRTFTDAVIAAGGLPLLLPATTDAGLIAEYLQHIDGLLLSGGEDVDPTYFGEAQSWQSGAINPFRDAFELTLCKEALKCAGMPIFGICRGLQVMNVALGGDIYQDLQSGFPGKTAAHRQKQPAKYTSHPIAVSAGTKLHEIVGSGQALVNSLHHQALRKLGDNMVASAIAPDGVIEAAELAGHTFFVGVQWHPELLWDMPGGEANKRLFETFVDACRH